MPHESAGDRLDDVFEALRDQRRRQVLYYLAEHDAATLDELTTVLTGWKSAREGERSDETDYEQVRTSLYHVHLPKLDAAGFVSVDQASLTVELDAPSELASDAIDFAFEHDRIPEETTESEQLLDSDQR